MLGTQKLGLAYNMLRIVLLGKVGEAYRRPVQLWDDPECHGPYQSCVIVDQELFELDLINASIRATIFAVANPNG